MIVMTAYTSGQACLGTALICDPMFGLVVFVGVVAVAAFSALIIGVIILSSGKI